jgi:YtkA-like protein
MKTSHLVCAAALALIGLGVAGPGAARADIKDYEFRLVEPTVKKGERFIAVQLLNKTTGKPVPDAVIFAVRLDMEPDGMEDMDTRIAAMPGGEPGLYSFKANFSMTGRWRLSLGAKVQGETGTVDNKLLITALK